MAVRLVVFGRQGAGKGTQCVRLAERLGAPHISTGDMLRAAVDEGTEFGRKADEFMSAGNLVPDEVIDTMTITGTPAECARRIAEYDGLADEIIIGRVPQPDEPAGVAAFEPIFELAGLAG